MKAVMPLGKEPAVQNPRDIGPGVHYTIGVLEVYVLRLSRDLAYSQFYSVQHLPSWGRYQ
jgi:hypothetical protein